MLEQRNAPEVADDGAEILRFTLAEVRRERIRRRVSLAVLCPVAVAAVLALLFQGDRPPVESVRVLLPGQPAAHREVPSSLAVLVVRDGLPTLQTLSPEDLGGMELRFSLEPITADVVLFEESQLIAAWPVP